MNELLKEFTKVTDKFARTDNFTLGDDSATHTFLLGVVEVNLISRVIAKLNDCIAKRSDGEVKLQ